VTESVSVPVRLLAELFNGRSRDCAVYDRQRQHGVELAGVGAEFQVGRMLIGPS
jgi:hypothetical protein